MRRKRFLKTQRNFTNKLNGFSLFINDFVDITVTITNIGKLLGTRIVRIHKTWHSIFMWIPEYFRIPNGMSTLIRSPLQRVLVLLGRVFTNSRRHCVQMCSEIAFCAVLCWPLRRDDIDLLSACANFVFLLVTSSGTLLPSPVATISMDGSSLSSPLTHYPHRHCTCHHS